MKSLPAIDWIKIKNEEGVETHIRLARESVEFWLKPKPYDAPEDQLRDLNLTDDDFRIFRNINHSVLYFDGILTGTKNDTKGNASQLVRFEKYDNECRWYTMHDVRDDCKKLGILFGFGHFEESVQPSIAVGDFSTAHTNGYCYVREFIHALFHPIFEAQIKYQNSDSD